MFRPNNFERHPRGLVVKWFLMAFIAGNVNAGGYLACHRFVTHVTGFATLFGIELAQLNYKAAFGMLSVPAYFLSGVMFAAYLTDRKIARGRPPRFDIVMGLVTTLLLLATAGGIFNAFGVFGTAFDLENDYMLLVILCTASGLQNAAITVASAGMMRSTHMTGTTTDLGIGIIRTIFGYRDPEMQRKEFYRTWLRLGMIISFGTGGLVGAFLYIKINYLGFLLPAGVAVYVGNLGHRVLRDDSAQTAAAARMSGSGGPKSGASDESFHAS